MSSKWFIAGFGILVFSSALLTITSLLILCVVPIGWSIVLAVITAGGAILWGVHACFPSANKFRLWGQLFSAVALIVLATLLVNSLIVDTSWDGQGYQSEGVIAISRGWNVYQASSPDGAYFKDWLAFYPKGSWIIAGTLAVFTQNIEAGKAPGILYLIASFAFAMALFTSLRTLDQRHVILLSAFVALNPVSILQAFTYYVDGQQASLITILVCILLLMVRQPKPLL